MTQSKVYIATPRKVQRFEWKYPDRVQEILAREVFDFREIKIDHFLLHYKIRDMMPDGLLNNYKKRTLIFSKGLSVGEKTNGDTQTLSELIIRYRPGPGLIFYPPYVALVQENLYESTRREFEKLDWSVERIVNTH